MFKNKTKILYTIFAIIIFFIVFQNPLYADNKAKNTTEINSETTENKTEEEKQNDSVDDIVIPTAENANIVPPKQAQENYDTVILKLKTLIDNYGYYAKFDYNIISTPIYRASVENPNSRYYFSISITELKLGEKVNISFVNNLITYLDSNAILYEKMESGDFNVLTFNCEGETLVTLKDITIQTKAFQTDAFQTTNKETYFIKYFNNDKRLTADQKYIYSNIQQNFTYKTTNPITYNRDYSYKTNEGDYTVYKFNFIPDKNTDIDFYITESLTPEIVSVNYKLQIVVLLLFVIGFGIYYYFDIKKEE